MAALPQIRPILQTAENLVASDKCIKRHLIARVYGLTLIVITVVAIVVHTARIVFLGLAKIFLSLLACCSKKAESWNKKISFFQMFQTLTHLSVSMVSSAILSLTLPAINLQLQRQLSAIALYILDLSSKAIETLSMQSIQSFSTMRQLKKILLANRVMQDDAFEEFIKVISNNPSILELHLSKSLFSDESQIEKLQKLASSKKGLKIIDSEGGRFGAIYMDWHEYNLKKQDAHLAGIRETTEKALDYFQQELDAFPKTILDFGCGTGQDTIPLLKLLPSCYVHAIDGDEEALRMLKSHVEQLPDCHVTVIDGDKEELEPNLLQHGISLIRSPFIEMKLTKPVDLFISSFTWPYRPPDQFGACWKKTIESVKDQGILAGHFFGPITGGKLDPGLTYHTEAELKQLLADSGCEIIWFKEEKEGTEFNIIAGDGQPSWGSLFHVVAKVIKKKDSYN